MTDDNIVPFPGTQKSRPPQNLDEVIEAVENIALYHVDEAVGPITQYLVDLLAAGGFKVDLDTCAKDLAFVHTCLRSMMLKTCGVQHPFQLVAEETFDEKDGKVTFKASGTPVMGTEAEELD